MPSSYVQLLVVNMVLAALISTTVLGAPPLPAVLGALGAGAFLYARYRSRIRRVSRSRESGCSSYEGREAPTLWRHWRKIPSATRRPVKALRRSA